MLFNSHQFIFLFLPIVFLGYFLLIQIPNRHYSKVWLVLSSLYFYGHWDIRYLPLILFSMLFNFVLGRLLTAEENLKKRKVFLTIGISVNLVTLMYFKYMDFFIENLNWALALQLDLMHIALPLAISFFTFQQIAYLVDAYRHETKKYNFLNYALFVTFFPQLIAGPIVYHKDIMPQFEDKETRLIKFKNISMGLLIFFIGLFKKVVIADTFAVWATEGFDHATVLTFFEGWMVSLSYTFQLYFDFSGYCDMAIGIALLFNIKLPVNFFSPYKALNIQDFWRRWHITLSGFFTKYVYIPLGGNRKGEFRTYIHILIIFALSGLWHGAGWTFILWGLLHGLASVVYRKWNKAGYRMNKFLAWFITFNFVNLTWVFFRATEWSDAVKVLSGMFGFNGVVIPAVVASRLEFLTEYTGEFFIRGTLEIITCGALIGIIMIIVLTAKNSIQLKDEFRPTWYSAVGMAVISVYSVFNLQRISEFLYFNF